MGLYIKSHTLHVTYTNEDPSKSNQIKQMIGQAIQKDRLSSVKFLKNAKVNANEE